MMLTVNKMSRVLLCGAVSVAAAAILNLLGILSFFSTFITLWTLSAGVYLFLGTLMVELGGKSVLITGCDSGFGHALALHLDAMGIGVFACCLNADGDGGKRLRDRGSSRLHVLQMDITKPDQITKALTQVKQILGSEGSLWGVVNNAAINPYGAVEWVSLESYKKLCDVNLFGTIAVTKAFLPLIRQAKGRVVTMGSVRGRLTSPYGSIYEVSKFGVEAFNDCLRVEMKPFDVKVSLIEPGNFTAGTKIFNEEYVRGLGKKMWSEMDDEVKNAYGKEFYDNLLQKQFLTARSGNPDLSEVIEVITEALTQRYPQVRYQPMDTKMYFLLFAATHFPEWLYDFIFEQLVLKSNW